MELGGLGYSYGDRDVYEIPVCFSVNMLTDEVSQDESEKTKFKVKMLEVWEVIFLD
jgi:hypothetical protein